MCVCMYIGVTIPQPTAERISQPAGRSIIIATNLTLILADKNQKIPARISISHFNNRFDEKYSLLKLFTVCKTFPFKKNYRSEIFSSSIQKI